ncbi:hypothetical protein Pint_09892 [Pistacia integerrima]|uniref:Uncharacterized protein n=1 Tax=Pistacia integerrima TaxID=434235 RepID=A0ACC0XJQ9_9ROSI|nr:hypothetical protein Pint_09892 [Pistacia integerrima]
MSSWKCNSPNSPSSPLLIPSLSSSSSSLNPCDNTNSQLCNTRAPGSSFDDSNVIEVDANVDSSVWSAFLPSMLKPSNETKIRDEDQDQDCGPFDGDSLVNTFNKAVILKEDTNSGVRTGNTNSGAVMRSLKILNYNVGFREDLMMRKKMKAVGDLIQQHSPDLICFQEVTAKIYDILHQSSWWMVYQCALSGEEIDSGKFFCMQLTKLQVKSFNCIPFKNSTMRRKLCVAEFKDKEDKLLVVASSHLEIPCLRRPTSNQMLSRVCVEQAKEAINHLERNENVIFCGDLNWDDKLDGQFPLPAGWVDAWTESRPGENGWMYELSGNGTLQKRQDRFICHLRDYKISRIDMIGILEAIPLLLLTISSQ